MGFSEDKQTTYYNQAKSLLENNNIDVVVTFDAGLLENVSQAKKDVMGINKEKASIEIYGTGSTSKILSFLEDKVISATAIQNEFNVGYLSIKSAVYKINKKDMPNNIISSTVINTKICIRKKIKDYYSHLLDKHHKCKDELLYKCIVVLDGIIWWRDCSEIN